MHYLEADQVKPLELLPKIISQWVYVGSDGPDISYSLESADLRASSPRYYSDWQKEEPRATQTIVASKGWALSSAFWRAGISSSLKSPLLFSSEIQKARITLEPLVMEKLILPFFKKQQMWPYISLETTFILSITAWWKWILFLYLLPRRKIVVLC